MELFLTKAQRSLAECHAQVPQAGARFLRRELQSPHQLPLLQLLHPQLPRRESRHHRYVARLHRDVRLDRVGLGAPPLRAENCGMRKKFRGEGEGVGG
jgi:hypothetical protein